MGGFISDLASYYATLVFIMNPFGAVPIFMDIVERLHPWERRRLANFVTMVVIVLLFLTAFAGDLLLRLYMISIDEFRFAGGVVLLAIALHRLGGESVTQTPDPPGRGACAARYAAARRPSHDDLCDSVRAQRRHDGTASGDSARLRNCLGVPPGR